MNMRRSPYSQTFLEPKKHGVFHIKSLNTSWSIDIEIVFGKKMEFFNEPINLRRSPDIWTIFGRRRNWWYFFKKKQWIWGGHLIPRHFLERKKHRVFHIKSLNTSWSIDIEIIFGKKWSFTKKQLIWEGDPIVWPFSKEKETEGISSKKTMNMRRSPYSQTVFRTKKTRSFSYKIIEYELVNRYWDHVWKKNGVFLRNN